jgi:hypothetical protein
MVPSLLGTPPSGGDRSEPSEARVSQALGQMQMGGEDVEAQTATETNFGNDGRSRESAKDPRRLRTR